MKTIYTFIACVLISAPAQAGCYGSGNYYRCTDSSGNSYSVNRSGGTTSVRGMDAEGDTWSQRSTSIGNSTRTTGLDQDGNNWSSTTTTYGGTTRTTGFDSDGNYFSQTCFQGRCR